MTFRSVFRGRLVAVAGALALVALEAGAANALPQTRYAGSYVATRVTGANVTRLELRLQADGSATLVTGSSRYTQRPTGVASHGQVVETGTWRVANGRAILHITKSSNDGDPKDAPSFEDLSFVLAGCELRLLDSTGASSFSFDKQRCAATTN